MLKKYQNYIILALVLLAFFIGYKVVFTVIAFITGLFVIDKSVEKEQEFKRVEENIKKYKKGLKDLEESKDLKIHQELEQTEQDLDSWLDQDL